MDPKITSQAFPSGPIPEGQIPREAGLSKREYAAIAFMQALLSNPSIVQSAFTKRDLADESVACADALLEKLKQP